MSLTETRADVAAELEAVLRAHPAIDDACATDGADGMPRLWVVPRPSTARVPAHGRCALVTDDGEQVEGSLVDVSYDGVRIHCDSPPPEVGAHVQMVIESDALGGVDGRLGTVRWRHGRELGVAFHGNFDEGHALVRFVQAFVDAAAATERTEDRVDPNTRIAAQLPCLVEFGNETVRAAHTIDVSCTGVFLELDQVPTVDWRDAKISLRLEVAHAPVMRGRVVRQEQGRLGIGLDADGGVHQFLVDLVRASVRDATISRAAIAAWLAAHGHRTRIPIEMIDAIPRTAAGDVDHDALG